ncbi:F0F1 ATP synthase subunit B [Hyphobacterium sp.]|uniref:F0F1 ATP synthase subunit B family protein n=1 Tax=Hyphobacterium sp. TaxID=2004662 RepID=UPI003BAB83CF
MHFDYLLNPTTDPTFWVFIGLVIVIGIAVIARVPGLLAKALDERAATIRNELDEARRMREEAQELMASYQRKKREAEAEAEAIVEMARKDAKIQAETARAESSARLERLTSLAEQRIAQAEAQAIADVKSRAADLAAANAAELISKNLKKSDHAARLKTDLADMEEKLNYR